MGKWILAFLIAAAVLFLCWNAHARVPREGAEP